MGMQSSNGKTDDLILSIDAGTQSIRAALIDLSGEIATLVKTPIEPYFSERPGWAEQDPDYYWRMLAQTCRQLLADWTGPQDAIKAVTVSTQRSTMINVDADGKPLRPAIVWLDQRKASTKGRLSPALAPLLKVAGMHDLARFAVQFSRSNWIQQNQPEIWERTHKFLFLSGYYTYKLTGEFVDSVGNVVGTMPFDVKKGDWAHRLDPKWRFFPMEIEKLATLKKPTELLGHITDDAAEQTGIPAGLPLYAASNDKACEVIGSGCLTPETACISFGTTATINTQITKYVELKTMMPPYPSAIPDQYYTEINLMRGMWMVTWFKEEFGLQERLEALDVDHSPEALLEKLIKDVPPGAMGLVLNPYWTPGPDVAQYAKGSVIGFGDVHTRAHLYRAIIEGLVFALKEGAELTEKKNKVPITELRVSGGGSQSDSVVQIAADVFGLPAVRPHTHETSALGAAIDAAVGLGAYPDVPAAVKNMTRVGSTFEPIAENQQIYQQLYHRVYKKIYTRLLPLFKDIKEITGYPE